MHIYIYTYMYVYILCVCVYIYGTSNTVQIKQVFIRMYLLK